MTQVFEVSGMHCGGCLSRVQTAADKLAPGTTVTLEPPRLTLPQNATLDATAINAALAPLGDYRVKPAG
ncbi:MAG: heavy-metal-associated domain-containing protein [Bosea sp. (in: a-proteobacteria)]|uniref:heavy-metal-associated domain-containing protein n=1 Tax=Bosea sp. (in: a-proteobacteria) TaxID=1871050 RepID=UPI0027352CAE|nr:heavy-metal-associated domain-containing protein [Bosea sp. (in: a-proteobacteria)]MDP3255332.1 heavy-metal-associated domain-containing protein [Bosea sp. (in: a-proteobacteria)]MDP3320358.1 heavy-metal-associated domain-containing protein [Bosea sp. (in: a-proteobacteria)]